MSGTLTRRGFMGSATTAGVLTQLALESAVAQTAGAPARRSNFDLGWRFSRGDFPGAEQAAFDDSSWSQVDAPHDWSIEGPFDENAPAGGAGGYLPTGIGWYRKSFVNPAGTAGKKLRIEFDGVYQRSQVWINGHMLGMRPYGFISFGYDLTPYLNSGDKPNIIAVRVDNSLQPNCRWYSGSGIYRHVWLIATDPVHIAPWGVYVHATDVSNDGATIDIITRVSNDGATAAGCALETAILDPNGTTVQTVSARAHIAARGEHIFVQRMRVPTPSLWSLATPVLYSLQSAVRADGTHDDLVTPFGIRQAVFDVDHGLLLNGEHVKINGVCLHGDCGAVGTAVPERMWERRIQILQQMGCNAIRCSHNPPAPEFLDLCDRMGMLVMDEAFDEWRHAKGQTKDYGYHKYFDEWSKRDLSDMLERDRNHPSIVIWSAGNEIPDQIAPDGPKTLRMLKDIIRSKDPRPVTAACDHIASDPVPTPANFLAELDVVGYNYVDRWRDRREKYYSIDRHDYPKRRMIGTESVSMSGTRGVYRTNAPLPGRQPQSNGRIETEQLQKFVQTYDYVSGDFMWTGIDYIGESRWPAKSANAGVIDTCGFVKDGFHFYRSVWIKEPVLHLFPHWNWSGQEGQIITVSCYTNCDTVELFLDTKSYGVKGFAFPRPGMVGRYGNYPPRANALQTTADLHLSWDVPYAPGTLKAVGIKDGNEVATVTIATTGVPAAIRLSADRDHISVARSDLAHVRVEIVDAKGLVVPTAEDEISFAVQGDGRIIGVDNGRPDSHESYKGNARKAFGGLALVLLQSDGTPGSMSLSASAPSLTGAQVTVTAA